MKLFTLPILARCAEKRTAKPRGKPMKKRLYAAILMASMAAAPLSLIPVDTAQAQSVTRPAQDVVLSIGRGELVTVPGAMADVFIADENVADVQIKSQRQLYIFGKKGGETTVYASDAAGNIIWSANIRVGSNIGSIDQMLTLAMPEANVSVATMGANTVLLTGTVAAPEDAAEVERLVQAFLGEDANVINGLKMATPLQVNLQVRIAEVSRSLVRTLGANLISSDNSNGFQFGVTSGRTAFTPDGNGGSVLTGTGAGSTIGAVGKFLGLDIGAALDLAERDGLVTTLSQPNLTALSGETADFLAGGEFPIPITQGLGGTSVEYRKYGVSLAYTPTVLANGRISMRVKPEVSELSSQGAVSIDGFQIPGMTIRRAETTVELGSGQSFMIAGLMSNTAQNAIDKAPGLGDVPVLGNLFRSSEFRRGETELVIVVTPYLVKPVNANDIKLPTDGYGAPSEWSRTVGMRQNNRNTPAERPKPSAYLRGGFYPGESQSAPAGQLPAPTNQSNSQSAPAQPGFSIN